MIRIRRLFEGKGASVFGACLFLVGVLIVFFPVLAKYAALVAPDSIPFFQFAYRTVTFEGLLTGATFTPHTLYWLVFNPLYAHELTYVIDSFVLALSGVYYLSGRGVHPLAAWCGGLALGFCGYSFTLFSAGHRGYFHMFSCAVWAFGLLARCFETRKLFYFAMLGLVFAWGVPYQPDVLVLVGGVAAAYALWLTFREPRQAAKQMFSVWPRFAVSVMFLLVAGFGGIRSALTTQIANREAQIAGVSAQDLKPGNKNGKLSEAEKHERWIFATNWSLPPEDLLEFVAPGVFGNDSMQMPYPYWGRLGRPSDEVFQKGRMMPNYRQHTVYLGVVTVLLALLGVVAWASSRKRRSPAARGAVKAGPTAESQGALECLPPSASPYADVPFWMAVWVVCLLLAMGRYTPFYRLFYAIPYIEYIRCPVKFHHLVEVATAFLAGFGMDAFLRSSAGAVNLRRRLAWLAGGLSLVLCLVAGLMLVNKADIVAHVGSLGLGQVAPSLGGYAVQNLMRSVLVSALVAGVALAANNGGGAACVRFGYVLLVVVLIDQAWVARRFVRVMDVGPFYRENAVVKAVAKSGNGQVVNVVNYVTPNVVAQDWLSTSLAMNGVHNLAPAPGERGTPLDRLFTALQKDPLRLWRAVNAQYVVVPRKGAEGLLRAGVLRPVFDFELGNGQLRQVQPGEQSLVLAAVEGSVPGARAVTQWKGCVAPEKQAEAMAQSSAVVSEAPLAGQGPGAAGAVKLDYASVWGFPCRLSTRLTCASASPALILFNQRMDAAWEVLVDGAAVPGYLSEGVWLSAVVPQGTHQVVLRKKRAAAVGSLSCAAALAALIWCVCRAGRRAAAARD